MKSGTKSHPEATHLGWDRFKKLTRSVNFPIFALGGLKKDDLVTAIAHNAHGIAAIGALWNNY